MLPSRRNSRVVAISAIAFLIWCLRQFSCLSSTQQQTVPGRPQNWDYYPLTSPSSSSNRLQTRPMYGIMMGGTSDLFNSVAAQADVSHDNSILSAMMVSTCVAKLYAMNHGYAFKLVRNLESVSNRKYGNCSADRMSAWHKIQLVRTFLHDVDCLLWLDLDALIVRPTIPLDSMLNAQHRETGDLGAWMCAQTGVDAHHRNITGSSLSPFFFASRDINPRYKINLNTGVFAVKNTPIAFDFLQRVWEVGDNPEYFKKHDMWWRLKTPCEGYWGWPWEQGGVWDVLADASQLRFLRGTVFLPSEGRHALNSVIDNDLKPGDDFPFVLHGKGSNEVLSVLYLTKTLLEVLGASQSCLLEECPAVFDKQHLLVNVSYHYSTILRKMMMT